eukprot:6287623-Pyramimonas_sp.AAC.1
MFCFYVAVKIAPFERFPIVIGAIAHDDVDVSRRYVRKLMRLHDRAAASGDRAVEHPRVVALFSPGPGRDALQAYADEGEMSEALLVEIAMPRFVSIVEVGVKRLHAQVSKSIRPAPHHGPVHIALSQHGALLEE